MKTKSRTLAIVHVIRYKNGSRCYYGYVHSIESSTVDGIIYQSTDFLPSAAHFEYEVAEKIAKVLTAQHNTYEWDFLSSQQGFYYPIKQRDIIFLNKQIKEDKDGGHDER